MIRADLSEQDIVNNMLELAKYLAKQENDANAINIAINRNGKSLHMHFEAYTDGIIKALEQEPCEDAVSRKAALDIYDDYNVAVENGELEAYRKHRKRLLKLPSAQPKTGHWIDDKCSVCGNGIEDLIDSQEWYRNEEPNFCPFCGTKMVEPQENTDARGRG